MVITADIKCYHCGHVSGHITGDVNEPVKLSGFRPSVTWMGKELRPGQAIRCFRCGGPVFLDDVQTVRQRPSRTEYEDEEEAPRRRRAGSGLLSRKAS